MKLKAIFTAVVLSAALTGCSLFTAQPTPSTQVLTEVRAAETAYLVAITAINIKRDGKPLTPDEKAAESIVFAYLQAAKDAANSGDTVTVDQKLDLFNQALAKFNAAYTAPPTTGPER